MQKHSQLNNDEQTQFFRKIYLSHFNGTNGTKWLRKGYVWEVSWRLNKDCNILTPSSSGHSSASFSSCGAAQPGILRAQLSAGSGSHCFELQQLTPNSDLQLTRTSCGTGLYNCLLPTCFSERRICIQFNLSTVKVIPWYLRPDAPVIYTGAFLIWQRGRVGGQYVTILPRYFFIILNRQTWWESLLNKYTLTIFKWKLNFVLNQICQDFMISRGTLSNQNGYY